MRDLFDLFCLFDGMEDPDRPGTGQTVLVGNAWELFVKEMWYVQWGMLSDKPGVPLYERTRQLRTGFWLHRCCRGGSALEGMHLHYRLAEHVTAKASGLASANSRMGLYAWDWNVRAEIAAKLIPDIGHTRLWLIDAIVNECHGLPAECIPAPFRKYAPNNSSTSNDDTIMIALLLVMMVVMLATILTATTTTVIMTKNG